MDNNLGCDYQMRRPGIEPGSRGWEPSILTSILAALKFTFLNILLFFYFTKIILSKTKK